MTKPMVESCPETFEAQKLSHQKILFWHLQSFCWMDIKGHLKTSVLDCFCCSCSQHISDEG